MGDPMVSLAPLGFAGQLALGGAWGGCKVDDTLAAEVEDPFLSV